jgi:glycosyltransferase involved in cell wall biosynthesis
MKIVIVMTYFNRQYQLTKTLQSISQTKHRDFEVIIIDDCSEKMPSIANYHFLISVYRTKNKKWIDGSPAYNLGILHAIEENPDIIILQNAETYHVGDVIKYVSDNIKDNNYISFGCYNLSKEFTFKKHDINAIIKNNNVHAVNNDNNAWLNHKTIRQMGYHWCSAITIENLTKLNGFDERFCDGYCFEDDEFLARVKMMGLKVEITDFPFVVHQWHDRNYMPKNWNQLFNLNKKLYNEISVSNNYRAIHKFIPDFNVQCNNQYSGTR